MVNGKDERTVGGIVALQGQPGGRKHVYLYLEWNGMG